MTAHHFVFNPDSYVEVAAKMLGKRLQDVTRNDILLTKAQMFCELYGGPPLPGSSHHPRARLYWRNIYGPTPTYPFRRQCINHDCDGWMFRVGHELERVTYVCSKCFERMRVRTYYAYSWDDPVY